MTGSGSHLSCSFCGKTQSQVKKLIAGLPASPANPYVVDAFICDGCVGLAHAATAESAEQCSFCHEHRHQVVAMASAGGKRICGECLELCDGILSDEAPAPSR